MTKTKKTQLEDLSQLNGKISTSIPSTLDSILSENLSGRYSDIDEDSYAKKLEEMNLPELQSLAHDKGVMVLEDKQRLKNELLKEYRIFNRSQKIPTQELKQNKSYKIDAAAARILNEGK